MQAVKCHFLLKLCLGNRMVLGSPFTLTDSIHMATPSTVPLARWDGVRETARDSPAGDADRGTAAVGGRSRVGDLEPPSKPSLAQL